MSIRFQYGLKYHWFWPLVVGGSLWISVANYGWSGWWRWPTFSVGFILACWALGCFFSKTESYIIGLFEKQ